MFLLSRINVKVESEVWERLLNAAYRSSHVVGLVGIPVCVQHRADPVAPGILVLRQQIRQTDPGGVL